MKQKTLSVESTRKLARLQKDYILKTVAGLEEMIALANTLENLEDPDLIKAYCERINVVDSEVQSNYETASKILPIEN